MCHPGKVGRGGLGITFKNIRQCGHPAHFILSLSLLSAYAQWRYGVKIYAKEPLDKFATLLIHNDGILKICHYSPLFCSAEVVTVVELGSSGEDVAVVFFV